MNALHPLDLNAVFSDLQAEYIRRGVAEEIRKADAQIERDLPAIRNHEDCLFRAIQDMNAARAAQAKQDETDPGPGYINKRLRQADFSHTNNYVWAYANALKHMKALREEFPYYKLPDYLREAYNNAVGA